MKKILIVEDEEKIRKVINILVKSDEVAADEASDGMEALNKIKNNDYDLVILDLMLPVVDGMTILKDIRADSRTAALPVIVVSAKNLNQDLLDGFQGGANYYITKPFEPKELIDSIELILGVKY
ncbi:MAG: response regulator transcription factor [bacterium]